MLSRTDVGRIKTTIYLTADSIIIRVILIIVIDHI